MSTQAIPPALPEDEYLSHEQLVELHGRLQAQLAELLDLGTAAVSELTREEQTAADHLDQASTSSDRDLVMRKADRERQLLHKVKTALRRIAEGEYGACELCGEEITFGRLSARLVATQCIDCKSETERTRDP
ncbi:MAG: RNA polymerase-binding protein DksA [Deltaproteobacteria bacterium]|nr:MAG: RNA polymerase-binding protein DksA [Deltaproteobacteria bacterium]